MPNGRGSGSLKNRELYEELRNEGASKEKAARISNAVERDGARQSPIGAARPATTRTGRSRTFGSAPVSSDCRATPASASRSSSRCCASTDSH